LTNTIPLLAPQALAKKVYEDFKRFDGLHEFKEGDEGLIFGQNDTVDDDFKGALPEKGSEADPAEFADVPRRRDDQPEFIPSKTFQGKKEGYVFGKGGEGGEDIGYSWDIGKERDVERRRRAAKNSKVSLMDGTAKCHNLIPNALASPPPTRSYTLDFHPATPTSARKDLHETSGTPETTH
jgi:hypothetical protein